MHLTVWQRKVLLTTSSFYEKVLPVDNTFCITLHSIFRKSIYSPLHSSFYISSTSASPYPSYDDVITLSPGSNPSKTS